MSQGLPTFVQALAVLALQPFSELLRTELTAFATGRAELSLPVRRVLTDEHGSVHSGVISYAVDSAITFAGGSVLGPGVVASGLHIQHVRAARGDSIRAVAEVVTVSGDDAVCRCDVLVCGAGVEFVCAVALGSVRRTVTGPVTEP